MNGDDKEAFRVFSIIQQVCNKKFQTLQMPRMFTIELLLNIEYSIGHTAWK